MTPRRAAPASRPSAIAGSPFGARRVGSPGGLLALAGAILAALGAGACGDGSARDEAAPYPSRPIEIVSWATPGGPTDLLARALARVAPSYFEGRRMTVITRQGGAGAAAMQYLRRRAGDAHVLAVFTASGTVNMASGRIPFGPADFTPLLRIQVDPFLIAVREESPFRVLGDLFGAARERPGEVSISGFGAASAHFLGFARLRAEAGDPDIRWIAYGGSSDAVVAALGGHTDAVHTNYDIVREHVRAGTMRVLAVAQPVAALPGTPTYADAGFRAAPSHWRGVVAPPGVSAERQADLRARLEAAIQDPAFRRYMEEAAMEYAPLESAEAFARWMVAEVDTSRTLLARFGLLEAGPSITRPR